MAIMNLINPSPWFVGLGVSMYVCACVGRCREAIHLLQLPRGSACLLLEELNGAVPDRSAGVIGRLGGVVLEEAMTTAVDALNEMKVHSLSPQQALAVLQQRIYSD